MTVKLTPQGVALEVERIRKLVDDPEEAHDREDALYEAVLKRIAVVSTDLFARQMAKEALKTKAIDFPRWMA